VTETGQLDALEFERHNAQQRAYFEHGETGYMAPTASRYVVRQVDELVRFADLRPGSRVLEAGCGMGRYTFPLAGRGLEVEGLDLSPWMLERLGEFDAGRHDLQLHCADLLDPPPALYARFDAVVGFFTLHHLPDVTRCFEACASLLKPGGRVVFLEPNPYNPLYYLQLVLAPGMSWQGERGIVGMRRGAVFSAMAQAGFRELGFERFGFLPPAVVNRPRGAAIEARLERVAAFRGLLPFALFGGTLA
jgi:SAM-dependent methyltransferase